MAHVLNDRVKETSTSTGTGTINLAGAVSNFETFVAGIGDGNTTYYAIVHRTANEFEIGLGTITDASTDTLTGRSNANVISSSNSDNVVDFSAGTKDVFCTLPASKAITLDNSGNISLSTVTLDSSGNITLDADGGTITFADAGSSLGTITSSGYSGNAGTATALATARNIGGVSFDGTGNIDLPGVNTAGNQNTSGTAAVATVATTVTITDNESTNEDNAIVFTSGGDVDGGNIGLESDGTLTYNPSTGKITATGFVGTLTGDVTGDVTGTSSIATTVTVADESSDTTCFPLFTTAATGNLPPKSGSNLTFNSSTGILTATGFAGALTGNVTGTADVATVATTVTITDNESTNENNAIVFTAGGDVDGGNLGLESDGDLTYNPSTGTVTATAFSGSLTGNASTATALATARDIGGVSFDGTSNINLPGVNTAGNQDTTGTATNASHVLVTDNESTNEENLITFVEDATSSTGNVGLEMDGNLTYNPSTGTVTATVFKGNIDAVDGDFDGTLEADEITVGGTALNTVIAGVTVTNATNATNASHVLVTDNESTNEENLITFVEDATSTTGNVGLEMDGNLTYNPSTGTVTATGFSGSLTGNASTATALATARNIGGVSFDGTGNIDLPGVNTGGNQDTSGTATNATNAAHVLVTDNESTNEENLITFVEDATSSTGNVGLEMDGNLTYNPSTGTVTATGFSGNLTGTLQTAAQTNVTSLGTLTALTVDNININGNTVISTDTNGDINLTPNGTGKVNITSTSNTNTLQLTSADASSGSAPDMVFLRNSSSPADNDFLGRIDFQGTNSVAGTHVYGGIFSRAIDVTDGTEDGQIHLSTSSGGTLDTTGDLIVKSGLVTAPKTGFYRNLVTTATASFGDTILSTGQVFTDSYDVYEVYFKQVVLDTDDVSGMWIRLLDSSGNQISTETYGYYNLWLGNSASDNNQIDNRSLNTSAWKLSGNDEFSTGNASGEGFSGFFRLHNTRETSYEVIGGIQDASYKSVDGYAVRSYGSVWRNSTTAAISGCQLMVFSGVTISSASLAVYGYKLGV